MTDDQAKDIFGEMLANEADWAAEAIENAPKQELPPVKETGLSYTGDSVNAAGEARSVYTFTYGGTFLFDVHADLSVDLPVPAGVKAVKAHPIRIVSMDGKTSIDTKGLAFVTKHDDGLVHVDGQSVMSYVYPRVLRYVVKLYVK